MLTKQHLWLFDLYLCSSSRTYHCLFDDWCACLCLDGISFVCLSVLQPHLFPSPFVPFQSSIMNRLIRVRPSQKLVYEKLSVQTKIINGRSRMKFYLKHHWGGGKASVGFDQDLIRTLVSMTTVSSHSVTVGKTASSNSRMFLIGTFLILAGIDDIHESLDVFEIGRIRPWTKELAALQRMKKPKTNRLIIVKTISSHFLQYFFSSPEPKAYR